MGAIMDIYQLIRDLIDEADRQKNVELVSALIDIKKMVSALEDENRELQQQIKLEKNIERYPEGLFITLVDDDKKIKYCSTCWGNEKKLIQINPIEQRRGLPQCPICLEKIIKARTGGGGN